MGWLVALAADEVGRCAGGRGSWQRGYSRTRSLVSGTPERLSLQVLSALCDILACTPADLVVTTAENAGVRKTGTTDTTGQSPVVAKLRPRPARICCDRALRVRGRCPGCGEDRVLPGLAPRVRVNRDAPTAPVSPPTIGARAAEARTSSTPAASAPAAPSPTSSANYSTTAAARSGPNSFPSPNTCSP